MRKNRILYLTVVAVVAGVYIDTNQRLMWVLLIFLGWMAGVSGLFLLLSGRRVRVRWEMQEACTLEQETTLFLVTEMARFLPTGCVGVDIVYENRMFGTVRRQTVWLEPGSKQKIVYQLPFRGENCGRVRMDAEKIICCDMLGLFVCRLPRPEPKEITVYPRLLELQTVLAAQTHANQMGDDYDNKKGQDVTEVYSMRDYQEGDSVKSIHWKLSGKLDRLIIREFGHPVNYHTMIFCDCSLPKIEPQTINHIFGMTVSLSRSLLQQDCSHHVAMMNGEELFDLPVEDNASHMQMMASLMNKQLKNDNHELNDFIRQDGQAPYSKVVLVTGKLQEEWVGQLSQSVDLTVVLLSAGQKEYVEQRQGYGVVAISMERLKKRMHTIQV